MFRMLNRMMSLLLNVFLLINVMESHEMRNNSTAVPVSERSAMISNDFDMIKVVADLDREKTSTWSSRKFDVARSRSILNSQRRFQSRWPNEDCQRRCKNNNVDDICRLKCRFDKRKMENESNKTSEKLPDGETLNTLGEKGEILDTAASVHGNVVLVSAINDIRNKSYTSDETGIKEIFNMINDKDKLHKDSKEKLIFESSTKLSTTGKINRRKYTRTSVLPLNQTKPTIYRGRVRYSPSNVIRAKMEKSDTISGFINPISTKKSNMQSTTPLISKNEDVEIMEVSVAKRSSTEKNIFWKTRNIIAINNYMRKLNPHLIKISTDSKFLSTKLPTRSVEIIHHDDALKQNDKSKIMSNETQLFKTFPTKIVFNSTTTVPPTNETPVFFADDRHYQQSDGEFDNFKTIHATTLETPSTQIMEVLTQSYASTINNTFRVLEKSMDDIITTTTTPYKSSTTLTPTISTFLNNISSLKNKTDFLNKSVSISIKSTLVTTQMTIIKEEAKTSVPDIIEEVVQPSPKSFVTTTANQLHAQYEGISTTSSSKPGVNDVYVESQNYNIPIYALAVAILILIVFVALIVVRQFIFKHKKKNGDIENYSNDIQPISPVITMDHSEDGLSSDGDDSVISETLEFNRNKLKFKSLLGEGNFGQVWKAEIEDQKDQAESATFKINIVAVKTERLNNGQGGLKAECEIMRKLLPAHPNVVTLLGACVEQEPHLVIMSYEMRGKLLSLLRTARGVMNNGNMYHMPNDREPAIPLSPRKLTGFAYDIAKGMEYISEKMIVHGDIAARNVLVDHNGFCKICDFGMSLDLEKKKKQNQIKIPRVTAYQNPFKFEMTTRIFGDLKNYAISKTRSDNCQTKIRPALPIRWMSPESLQYHIFSHESDVYAYGIVLWEISTLGITPYPTLTGREVIRGVIRDNIRPDIPSKCKHEMSKIMSQCWLKNPNERPKFSDIRKNLARTLNHWEEEISTNQSEYLDVSGFSEDYENGMIYFNRRVSEFECEI